MKIYPNRFTLLFVLFVSFTVAGCFNKSSDSVSSQSNQDFPVANVSFVLSATDLRTNLLRASGEQPEVIFDLKLVNKQNTGNPVILLRKVAQVSADGDSYNATVKFENVPALPCVAKMVITGGSIINSADSKAYSTWIGLKDLVPSSENSIELFGKGTQVASEVSAVLLEKLIEVEANVATLPEPIIAKVEETVAELDLTEADVYENSLTSFNEQWAPDAPPENAEFDLPAGYSSKAYPVTDSTANLSISNFNADSEVYLVLMNRGTSYATTDWSVSRSSSNVRANSLPKVNSGFSDPGTSAVDEYDFHLWLRRFPSTMPAARDTGPADRPALRAASLNESISFQVHLSSGFSTVNATCKKISDIPDTNKKVYYFVHDTDLTKSNLNNVLDGIDADWTNIYPTNRRIFGAEPENTLNGINVDDFYIFLSSELYTAGYFYAGDMWPKSQIADGYSNEKKMFYLQYPSDSSDLEREISDLSSTMAHEFQHMIHYYQKKDLNDDSAWLDEAMSGYAEYINGFKIENGKNQSKALQANQFFSRNSTIKLNDWHLDNDTNENVHAHYGKAYLFGVWLAQNYGTSGSVQSLLSVQKVEEQAVEAFTGKTFNEVAAKFFMAMLVNDTNGGVYGIKSLDLNGTYSFGSGWTPVTLTGPSMQVIDFSGTTSGSRSVAPFAATYVKITGGTGTGLNVNATLPAGFALFQLKKN